ncbi:hypothetical protein BZL29_7689 [Mycobacterium kansasii]|uniref:Uncharacterized protein n=1 Tax=Mycobacterium kansasii TaxID=1768 RepID=A0A1V3WEH0_MYCKA|nr:hypothetical protein BZL29_7689 [Mycobacterium kansasii]
MSGSLTRLVNGVRGTHLTAPADVDSDPAAGRFDPRGYDSQGMFA